MKLQLELSQEDWPQVKSAWARESAELKQDFSAYHPALITRIEEISAGPSNDFKSAHTIHDGENNYDAVFVRMLINRHDAQTCYTSINSIVLAPRLTDEETPDQQIAEIVKSIITIATFLTRQEESCRILRFSLQDESLLAVFQKVAKALQKPQSYRHIETERSGLFIVL